MEVRRPPEEITDQVPAKVSPKDLELTHCQQHIPELEKKIGQKFEGTDPAAPPQKTTKQF